MLLSKFEDEFSENNAGSVVGEEGAGEGGDEADADEEVPASEGFPGEETTEVAEHVGFFKVNGDDHGAE